MKTTKKRALRSYPKLYQGRWTPPFNNKLTHKQVDEIKTLCAYMMDAELAPIYNVTTETIRLIRREETWQWV